ncbi:MAG: exopolysaccharide biosynthesis polyprenyl glycosylphosphotransferase [Flavobacteriales bacterium]|nr:exopolysaccharide biosynthesis polyprenyl glycosylphosphotransferase [Flavobacteriales bacterium]MDA9550432.1 exopolysaccharide biosynthesis polyprenyl glycosylphosphotransferase [Flavobacteriaceae bacterium]
MIKGKTRRYSGLISPLSYFIDIAIITVITQQFLALHLYKEFEFKHLFTLTVLWIIVSVFNRFYYIYRYTNFLKIINLLFNQIVLFALSLFCFSGIFPELELEPNTIIKLLMPIAILIVFVKIVTYYSIKTFRSYFGGNYRKTIIIGSSMESQNLELFFNKNKQAGYLHKKTFSDVSKKSILDSINFVKEQEIDEIYCSTENINDQEVKALIKFCDNNLKTIKFIPNSTKLNSKKLIYETYDSLPILSLRRVPLQDSVNLFFKRLTDIIISLAVVVFVLSWLTPIIALFIKKESDGPVFFKQIRNGINYEEFSCLKFRSMIVNDNAHKLQATKGDTRVTKIGAFLRKTSLDEMPQFINVLLGDMSVVGPRPHMIKENDKYYKTVDKYMLRHVIKPGITGLAQVSGYRGEVEKESDIVNRIKFDIYYLENWSILLDVKIILRTILNSIKGEDKAY